ncbi:MAG: hypothetical protein C0625_08850, partial [Arcobacter sp.]
TIELDITNDTFTYTLLDNVDHPKMNVEDQIVNDATFDMHYEVKVTDGNGDFVTDAIKVKIADDIPTAEDTNITLDTATPPVNLVFTLDVSGSMGSNVNGRLADAVKAIKALVAEYEAQGNPVQVQLNTFDTTASSPVSGWMDSSTLSTELDKLTSLDWTNYEDALEQTEDNFTPATNGGETFVYFLSDGVPTVELNDNTTNPDDTTAGDSQDGIAGATSDTGFIDADRLAAWNAFISDPANNISDVYSVGINMADDKYLKLVSSNSTVVDTSDLTDTLLGTVVTKSGSLDFAFGADGAADGTGVKADGDKLAFTWGDADSANNLDEIVAIDKDGNPVAVVWTVSADGTALLGKVGIDTVIKVEAKDISTNPKYSISEFDKTSGIVDIKIPYTVTDGDGDSLSANLNVEIPNDIPTIDISGIAAVDEDALMGTTDADSYDPDVKIASGKLNIDFGNDGAGKVEFVAGQTTALTSEGHAITLNVSADGHTMTGVSDDGRDIFTIELDITNDTFTYTLLDNVDHPKMNVEDQIVNDATFDMHYEVKVTDGNGDFVTDAIKVKIADDIPTAEDTNITVDMSTITQSGTANLLFTLDVSGSMYNTVKDSNGNDTKRFEIAKASIISTIEAYEAKGEIEVNLTLFNGGADNYGWMSSSDAIAFLSGLSMDSNYNVYDNGVKITTLGDASTDYYDGLNETMSIDFTGHDADTTVAYFLSDGEPNTNSDKIDQDSDQTIKDWKTYVETNIDKLNVVGVGTGAKEASLKIVQVQDGDEVLLVKDDSTLGDVLIDTVVIPVVSVVTGSLDFAFGADGAADGTGVKVDGDKLAFTWGDANSVNNLDEIGAKDANGNPVSVVWIVSADGKTLLGTIGADTVIKVEAKDILTNPTYVISEVDKSSGIEEIKIPYTVTDGDGDSVSANLNVEIPDTSPKTTDDSIITNEDTTYTLTVADFGTFTDPNGDGLASVKIVTLPDSQYGTLTLNGVNISAGTVVSVSDINSGKLAFTPSEDTDVDNSFTFQVSDGAEWSDTHTTSVEVIAVADVPTTSIDVTKIPGATIDDTNITNTSNGYTAKAYNADGTLGTISTVSGTNHDGFGVDGSTAQNLNPASSSEIAYDVNSGTSEELRIEFDNDISSVTFSFAWKHGYDLGNGVMGESAVVEFYKDGVLLDTQTYTGGSDTIDGPYTLLPSGRDVFDEVRFSALGDGDDYLIHGLTYESANTSDEYIVDFSAALNDLDGSESLTVQISGVPEGATFDSSSIVDAGNGVWNVTISDYSDMKSISDSVKMIVPSGTKDFELDIKAVATETNDNANGQNYAEATDSDAIAYAYDETNSLTFGESTSNLLFTLDVSGSMYSTVKDSNGNNTQRFTIAKESMISTIEAYAANGVTEVNLTLFNGGANNYGWMSSANAIAFLSGLSMNSKYELFDNGVKITTLGDASTDYYDGLNETMSIDFTGHDADTTVAYFLSDGEPNTNSDKIDQDSDQTIKDWKTYVETNIDTLNVVGVGAGAKESPLKIVQVQDGDEVLLVKDESTLGDVLAGTVTLSTTGNVLENISGGDGTTSIDSIKVDGTTYTESDFPTAGIEVSGDGKLTFDFTTGEYTYSGKSSEFSSDLSKMFTVNTSDENGDITSLKVTIDVDISPNRTENIVDLADDDTIDLTNALANHMTTPVDGVDMTDGKVNNLNIDLGDIVILDDDPELDELKIFGESGDKVTLEGGDANWTNSGKTEIDGDVFNVYEGTNGTSNIKILIDEDVSIEPDL